MHVPVCPAGVSRHLTRPRICRYLNSSVKPSFKDADPHLIEFPSIVISFTNGVMKNINMDDHKGTFQDISRFYR